ncbi:hypothetical protein JQ617_30460 [Bradyrhizobium sp. KB893862 SZCCT0404]|uniref:hypothetical protein n=1 Tax=Bradyrhizobium sp. KB893862 SZCCT0404 TaxID=2807672 RepID=UPI001BA8BBA4|nr:hypothetical protein [Bradyrhizobium sp. KB893862 SZCCT0404]MBR1178321.1 hypothetical protein [Bradyrhizobium sp. KB893862 SZCCT0404]
MVNSPDAGEKLLARATAAIAEAKRLSGQNAAMRIDLQRELTRMRTRAVFHPSSRKLYSPLDFLEQKRQCPPQ